MKAQFNNSENSEKEKQLVRSILYLQFALKEYLNRKGKYDQELRSKFDAVQINLDQILEEIVLDC